MSSESLYGLDVPDELADLIPKDAPQEEIIESAYNLWLGTTKDLRKMDFREVYEPLYKEACNIIRPYVRKINGSLNISELSFESKIKEQDGIYFAALLNETDVEELLIGKLPIRMKITATYLRSDKRVEIFEDGNAGNVGAHAEGGIVINRGDVHHMGQVASGGLFINYGIAAFMGTEAKSGIFVNYGLVTDTMGSFPFSSGKKKSNGIWINCGKVKDCIGYSPPKDTTFITEKIPKKSFRKYVKSFWNRIRNRYDYNPPTFLAHCKNLVYGIGPQEIGEDKTLKTFMKAIKIAGEKNQFSNIETLAREVDAYVRENYKPRRVA